jgi:transcriptional regulator with XRE-family HTH domain
MQRFPEKLFTLRERHGMSQRDLAKALGFAQGHTHFLETGKRKPAAEFVDKCELPLTPSVSNTAT